MENRKKKIVSPKNNSYEKFSISIVVLKARVTAKYYVKLRSNINAPHCCPVKDFNNILNSLPVKVLWFGH